MFAAVLSHWILDLLTHRPDLPLWPGNEAKVGLGRWDSLPGTLLVAWAYGVDRHRVLSGSGRAER